MCKQCSGPLTLQLLIISCIYMGLCVMWWIFWPFTQCRLYCFVIRSHTDFSPVKPFVLISIFTLSLFNKCCRLCWTYSYFTSISLLILNANYSIYSTAVICLVHAYTYGLLRYASRLLSKYVYNVNIMNEIEYGTNYLLHCPFFSLNKKKTQRNISPSFVFWYSFSVLFCI